MTLEGQNYYYNKSAMSNEGNSNSTIDDVFTLKRRIGIGGMASVYEAEVNLDSFDYSQLYAYTQVQGENHRDKLTKVNLMSQKMKHFDLDHNTIRQILELHGIPIPGKKIAIKWSKPNMNQARFMAEWRSLICLNNENVIKVFGGDTYLERPYYAMEYLDNLIPPHIIFKEFSLKERLEVIIDACKGVSSLHENGIIHRDLKPNNLLTNRLENGQCITKVADLGLALTEETEEMNKAIVGSPHYMPPEQIKNSKTVDLRSDIYGLGACLYSMICGKKPYSEIKDTKKLFQTVIRYSKPTSVLEFLPKAPKTIDYIISCAMHPNKKQRYRSVLELQHDIAQFINDHGESLETTHSFLRFKRIANSQIKRYHYVRYLSQEESLEVVQADSEKDLKEPETDQTSNKLSPKLHKRRMRSRLRRRLR